ncbi:transposable element Tcb1 transposase [Trichonephila clavipes]|nr:transposable element Tcb1 transposase [Trichonephila clavipes]
MPFSRFRRQYEQRSLFERERIVGKMKTEWSARRVARQLGCSDCVVRRCWDQWIREMSFTRRPVPGCPQQTIRREDHNIVRNARVQPTASSAAIQAQEAEWYQVIFSDESIFNLSSDDNRVRVWRPHGERLNPALALQRHTAPTAGVMVWGAIAYNTQSSLVLIPGTVTAQRYVHDILQPHVCHSCNGCQELIFNKTMLGLTRQRCHKIVSATALPWPAPIPRFVSNRAHLGPFGTVSWAPHEFERTRGKDAANMERNVSRHHTELVCLNARSYRFVHSR